MSRLWALLACAGCLYFALHSVSAGIRGPDYVLFLFGLLFLVIAGGFLHVATGRVRA